MSHIIQQGEDPISYERKKKVADMVLLEHLLEHVIKFPPPTNILFISGDGDFGETLKSPSEGRCSAPIFPRHTCLWNPFRRCECVERKQRSWSYLYNKPKSPKDDCFFFLLFFFFSIFNYFPPKYNYPLQKYLHHFNYYIKNNNNSFYTTMYFSLYIWIFILLKSRFYNP